MDKSAWVYTEMLPFRCTKEQREALKTAAAEHGVSVAQYLRDLIDRDQKAA